MYKLLNDPPEQQNLVEWNHQFVCDWRPQFFLQHVHKEPVIHIELQWIKGAIVFHTLIKSLWKSYAHQKTDFLRSQLEFCLWPSSKVLENLRSLLSTCWFVWSSRISHCPKSFCFLCWLFWNWSNFYCQHYSRLFLISKETFSQGPPCLNVHARMHVEYFVLI